MMDGPLDKRVAWATQSIAHWIFPSAQVPVGSLSINHSWPWRKYKTHKKLHVSPRPGDELATTFDTPILMAGVTR